MIDGFAGKWAVITGGGSGIGLSCAVLLAQRGCNLILVDKDEIALRAAAREVAKFHVETRYFAVDVTDTESLEQIASDLAHDGIQVSYLVTAAGILQPMDDINVLDRRMHDRLWNINYHGTYHACRIWGEIMRRTGYGAIVVISSITSMRATPLLAYGPAKAALNSLVSSLAVPFASDGIRINAAAPGFTMTAALADKFQKGERDGDSILQHVPMRRFADASEVAEVITFLLSDAASAVTGITMPIDCGWLAGSSWPTFEPLPANTEPKTR
jgi:NAD(P)-dependent dehydrogenase (short-subunit alcohol dehydrogenase family)